MDANIAKKFFGYSDAHWNSMSPKEKMQSMQEVVDHNKAKYPLEKSDLYEGLNRSQTRQYDAQLAKQAEQMLNEQRAKEFAPLERDLPKGGRQMKIAEPLGSSPLPAAAAAGIRALPVAAGAAGMLIPSSIGEEQPIVDTGNKGVAGPLPQELKGSPVMQDMAAPTKMSKEQQLMKRFVEEGKKNISPDFSVDVPVEYEDEGTGEREDYTLNMKSKRPLSEMEKMKAAGIDASLGRTGGKINMPKNSKSNKVMLEEDED